MPAPLSLSLSLVSPAIYIYLSHLPTTFRFCPPPLPLAKTFEKFGVFPSDHCVDDD